MTRDVFAHEIEKWLDAVRDEALRLFDLGARPEQCLALATPIADSVMAQRAIKQHETKLKLGLVSN